MLLRMLFLLTTSYLAGENYYDSGIHCANEILKQNVNTQSIDKDNLKKLVSEIKQEHPKSYGKSHSENKKCSISAPLTHKSDSPLFVFVSFSMPDQTWLDISRQVQKIGGILVLRGLPDNSFRSLAEKLYGLRKKGVNAEVIIDPRLFQKYNILNVPSFVVVEGENFDKLSGNVTLPFALGKMKIATAKTLRSLL